MKTWIVSYADAAFESARERLMASAARHGIEARRPWGREALVRTGLYGLFASVLDRPRGGGYWLWKPFIIKETLRDMAEGDLLVYSDAGVEIVADLDPLFEICRERAEILLFANPYDDPGPPQPIVCRAWTKRDCFVFLDCDEPRYYDAPLVDASFLIVRKTPRAVAFIREWLLYCCQPQLLIDGPSVCGQPELPGFVNHRWDQSLLSLLAEREHLELYRQPSQHGNHLKPEAYREAGEWTRVPHGTRGLFHNSPYRTLLHHHRGAMGQSDLRLQVRRVVDAPRERLFRLWTDPGVVGQWSPLGMATVVDIETDVRVGGRYRYALSGNLLSPGFQLRGEFLEVDPPARLVYTWPWHTRVTVDFQAEASATRITLQHEPFPTEQIRAYHAIAWENFLDGVAAAAHV